MATSDKTTAEQALTIGDLPDDLLSRVLAIAGKNEG
jgi:hypothetical protein